GYGWVYVVSPHPLTPVLSHDRGGAGAILLTMSRAAALREHDDTPNSDHIVFLHDVTWEDYERLLEIRGVHSAPRISYLEGEVEIMSPSMDHELIKSYIGRLLEAWCMDRGIKVRPVGSWTLKREKNKRGAEPDECYIFGKELRESPQLAIEVEWTRGGIDKLEIYRKLGVEEVWYWRKGVIEIYTLTKGAFARAQRSRIFPQLDVELLASMLDRDSLTDAVHDYKKALEDRGE
ncbi:MAG TPA: Uma2 family endonuclease, partial [Thermoanaerobaculia bacterium]|nr:Uma2 family endonuclease [Thermoanaerobaculia bacterium]